MIRRWIDRRAHPVKKTGVPGEYLRHELHVEINQVRPEALRFVQTVLGGRLSFNARNGPKMKGYAGKWLWSVDSTSGADILRVLRPFLFLKGAEADVAMQFQALKLKRGSARSFKRGLSVDEIVERDRLYDELRRLKRLHNDPAVQAEYRMFKSISRPVHP